MRLYRHEEDYIHRNANHDEIRRKAAEQFREREAPIYSELVKLGTLGGGKLLAEFNGFIDETEYWVS